MVSQRSVWAGIGLLVLTVAGMASVYQLLFSLWMTAYPFADIDFWRPHFYFRLAQTVLIGVFWTGLAVWKYRNRRRS